MEITSPINLSFSTTKTNKYNANSNYAYIDFDKLNFHLHFVNGKTATSLFH